MQHGGARRVMITGLPGSGKSTVGRLVAAGLERSVYIDADVIRESIVGGFVPPELPFTDAFIEQVRLQREIVTLWAERMVAAGYTAVIDDAPIPPPPHFQTQYSSIVGHPGTIKVLLRPPPDELTRRLEQRRGPFDDFFLERIDAIFQTLDEHDLSDWHVIDSTDQSPSETAATVLGWL